MYCEIVAHLGPHVAALQAMEAVLLIGDGFAFGAAEEELLTTLERTDVGAFDDAAGICVNSFDPATLVLMADGTAKSISAVAVGDQVESSIPATGKSENHSVTQLHKNLDSDFTDVTVGGSGQPATLIHSTTGHLFWDDTAHNWIPAGQLRPGDQLHTTDNKTPVTVTEVHSWTSSHFMRNLTVQPAHTYYVMAGNTPVLVHNSPWLATAAKTSSSCRQVTAVKAANARNTGCGYSPSRKPVPRRRVHGRL